MICPRCKYDKAIQLFTSIACDRCDNKLNNLIPDHIVRLLNTIEQTSGKEVFVVCTQKERILQWGGKSVEGIAYGWARTPAYRVGNYMFVEPAMPMYLLNELRVNLKGDGRVYDICLIDNTIKQVN